MTLTQPAIEELSALRDLERAVRACGLPSIMVSGQKQLEMLSAALDAVAKARKVAETQGLPVS